MAITMVPATDDAEQESPEPEEPDRAHLDDVDDGCGCAEVWETLSERRAASDTDG